MNHTAPLLSIKNVGCQLSGRWLWRGVSFDIFENECIGLVAPSGTGKTLLMRNLVLLDPVQEGDILLDGKPPTTWSLPIYRTQVMYLPQRATAFEGTVLDNLKQVFQMNAHKHLNFNLNAIENWLNQLGRSSNFLNQNAVRLSGGENQLLALLRALQLSPKILLLDEPTASLDPDTTAKVEFIIKNWLQQPSHACLLTSHDKKQIERLTNRKVELQKFT